MFRYADRICVAFVVLLLLSTQVLPAQYSGNALFLDSTGSYASSTIPLAMRISPGDAYTLEAWVYADADNFVIVSGFDGTKRTWGLSVGPFEYCASCSDPVSVTRALILDEAGKSSIGSSVGLVWDAWNHVAVTSNGSTVRFYINGTEAGTYTDSRSIWHQSPSSAALYFGSWYDKSLGKVESWMLPHGRLDNLYFWGLQRSYGDIKAGMLGNWSKAAGGFGLVEWFLFDSLSAPNGAQLTLHDSAFTAASTVPYFSLPTGYGYGSSDVLLLWEGRTGGSSSILQASIAPGADDEYLAVGHSDSAMTLRTSSIPGVSRQMRRSWGVMPVGVTGGTFTFDLSGVSGLDAGNGVILISDTSDFSRNVEYLFAKNPAVTTSLSANYRFRTDTVYATLGELSFLRPALNASLGFGPFAQSENNLNTFTVDSLPSGTSGISFSLYDVNRGVTIDSVSVSPSSPSYTYQMGDLPVGAILRVDIRTSSLGGTLRFVEPLAIAEQKPSITSSTGFDEYVLYTPKTVIYAVDSLPTATTAVTMRLADINGATVRFIDTSGILVMDSLRIDTSSTGGAFITEAEWTVKLDTLDLPLGTQLAVLVEHTGGVPGGTEYFVPLQILPPRMTVFSTDGFGPFVSNNYSRVINPTTPWEDVPDVTNRFTVEPLPPRTSRVIFRAMLKDSTFVYFDTVSSNGSQWLTAAESDAVVMTGLSPNVRGAQAVIIAQGGPTGGLLVEHGLHITPQLPRVFFTPSDYDNVVRNPYNVNDRKQTPVTVRVEPSTRQTDSVVAEIVDLSGQTIYRTRLSPVGGTTPGYSFSYDFASLYFTADSIIFHTWSPEFADSIRSAADITLIPPRPVVRALNGMKTYHPGSSFWEFFEISGVVPEVRRVDVDIRAGGNLVAEIEDLFLSTGRLWSPGTPYNQSLRFDGASTWLSTEPMDSPFTLLCWFRSTDSSAPLLGLQNPANQHYTPLLYLDEAGRLVYTLTDSASGASRQIRSVGTFNDGEWHHVGLTYAKADRTMELYVDFGAREASTQAPANARTGAIIIGRGGFITSDTIPAGYFAGNITELTVWKGRKDYDSLVGIAYPSGLLNWSVDGNNGNYMGEEPWGLTHHIPFNEGGGNLVLDEMKQDEYVIHGTAEWTLVKGMRKGTVGWNLETTGVIRDPEAQIDSASLVVSLYYPGSPSNGEPYTTWLPLAWDTVMYVRSDRGFGPFRQGVELDVTFTGTMFENLGETSVTAVLADSNGSAIRTHTDNVVPGEGLSWTFDMGEAKPGSTLTFTARNASNHVVHVSPPYELIVEPFVPPTVAGLTGPFKRAIVDGTMPDSNTFTITSFENDVRFAGIFYGPDWTRIDSIGASNVDDTTWKVTYDMAALKPPTSYLVVETFVGNDGSPDARDTVTLDILETRPAWIDGDATISDVTVAGNGNISFHVLSTLADPVKLILPGATPPDSNKIVELRQTLDVPIPKEIPILGGAHLTSAYPKVSASVTYNPAGGVLSLNGQPTVSGGSKFLSQDWPFITSNTNATIDQHNNLQMNHKDDWSITSAIPGFSSSIGNSGSIFTLIKALIQGEQAVQKLDVVSPYVSFRPLVGVGGTTRLHVGTNDSGQWGAIGELNLDGGDNPNDASYQVAQFGLGLQIGIGVQAFWGAAACEFDLSAEGYVAGGVSYITVPEPKQKELSAIGFNMYGEIVAKFLWGLARRTLWGPDMFFHHSWGDKIPPLWPRPTAGPYSALGTEEIKEPATAGGQVQLNSALQATIAPLVYPQPATSSRHDALGVVWIEQDPNTGRGTLKFASLSSGSTTLADAIIIASNSNAISVPRVDNLTDSTHLVVWSQSRYSAGSVPFDADPLHMAQSIDIWYAVVNARSKVVEQTGVLGDDFSGSASGRLEGNPDVTALNPETGMVTWIVGDPGSRSSEIYYALIGKGTEGWEATTPGFAVELNGVESSLRVIATGESTAAAVWINRSASSSSDPSVMTMNWNGNSWSSTTQLLPRSPDFLYNELDGVVDDGRGLLAVSGLSERNGQVVNRIAMIPWNGTAWDAASQFTHTDTSGYLQRPRVGLDDDGVASVLFQIANSAVTNETRVSHLDLILVDLNDGASIRHHAAHELLCDTGTMLRGSAAAMYGKRLVAFAHEVKTPYAIHEPVNGRQFGRLPTNLIIRAVEITDNLDIRDADEEDLLSSVRERPILRNEGGGTIESITPIPFAEHARIVYRLQRSGEVRLEVIDAAGGLVALLSEGKLEAGEYTAQLSGADLPNGAYFVRLTVEGKGITRGVLKVE